MNVLIYDQECDTWRPGVILSLQDLKVKPWDGNKCETLLVYCKKSGSLIPEDLVDTLASTNDFDINFK